jgi:hypothetical protein
MLAIMLISFILHGNPISLELLSFNMETCMEEKTTVNGTLEIIGATNVNIVCMTDTL